MDLAERYGYQYTLSEVFRPGAPIDSQELFSGRLQQVDDVIAATFQPGQHVVMFGERGVGKTSLARSLADILKAAGVTSLSSGTVNCDGTDNFSKLWHKIFRELQVVVRSERAGFSPGREEISIDLDEFLPTIVTPNDVRVAISRAVATAAENKRMIIILDEVDRITKPQVTTLLADTIKTLSDHLVPATLILIGVADAVEQLVAEHKSIERCLVQVPMPRMSAEELTQIIDKGFKHAKMTIEGDARTEIVELSQGLPHFTHLLCLESALVALNRSTVDVSRADVLAAMKVAANKSHTLLSAYKKAINSPQQHCLFEAVLIACALAEKDELGWFSASSITVPLERLTKKVYRASSFTRHLNKFTEPQRGPVLQRYEDRQNKYRFVDPLQGPFAIIRALASGKLETARPIVVEPKE